MHFILHDFGNEMKSNIKSNIYISEILMKLTYYQYNTTGALKICQNSYKVCFEALLTSGQGCLEALLASDGFK